MYVYIKQVSVGQRVMEVTTRCVTAFRAGVVKNLFYCAHIIDGGIKYCLVCCREKVQILAAKIKVLL